MAIAVEVKKRGSSLAMLIPRQFARLRKISVGTVIDLEPVRIVRPRRYRLAELLAGYKSGHRHGEWNIAKAASPPR